MTRGLHHLLEDSARRHPDRTALEDPETDSSIAYRDLNARADRVRELLEGGGVKSGDRVGIYSRKSIDAVASIFGILKSGAAYVPVDAGAPVRRDAYILHDCSVSAIAIEPRLLEGLQREWGGAELAPIGEFGDGMLLVKGPGARDERPSASPEAPAADADPLAYILYTSGSTGKPKGVMLSHRGALDYIDWCTGVFEPTEEDRFSSHAPFHFDLSILDVFLSIKHAATLVLIGDELGKSPLRLASLIPERRISIWYSTPTVLTLLVQYGKLDRCDCSSLRFVFFAGEVFPVKHLRALKEVLPGPRYFNLYGPTETNVCTYFEVPPDVAPDRTEPFPIGKTCRHLRARVVDEDGRETAGGDEGELVVAGASVLKGYWNLPERTADAFIEDNDGAAWYKTGDVVREDADGNYLFIGRRDRMVKRRGYRVELGEIEAALYRHPMVSEAATIAVDDGEGGIMVKAFLKVEGDKRPSIIEMKRFCSENLPQYMIPDRFSFQPSLPKTSTDKIDYQSLKDLD